MRAIEKSLLLTVAKSSGYIPRIGEGGTWGSARADQEAEGEEGNVEESFYCDSCGNE